MFSCTRQQLKTNKNIRKHTYTWNLLGVNEIVLFLHLHRKQKAWCVEQRESLLDQPFHGLKLGVVDDGSKEACPTAPPFAPAVVLGGLSRPVFCYFCQITTGTRLFSFILFSKSKYSPSFSFFLFSSTLHKRTPHPTAYLSKHKITMKTCTLTSSLLAMTTLFLLLSSSTLVQARGGHHAPSSSAYGDCSNDCSRTYTAEVANCQNENSDVAMATKKNECVQGVALRFQECASKCLQAQ